MKTKKCSRQNMFSVLFVRKEMCGNLVGVSLHGN